MKFTEQDVARMVGVHPKLLQVVDLAAGMVAFEIGEGLRSRATQEIYVASGKSKTMNSRHMMSAVDGYGHAVDLWPLVAGKPSFDWKHYYGLAEAMRAAAIGLGTPIRWGGVWDIHLNDIKDNPELAVVAYSVRERQRQTERNISPVSILLDGPHFELPADVWP